MWISVRPPPKSAPAGRAGRSCEAIIGPLENPSPRQGKLRRVAVVVEAAGEAERDEGVEHFLHIVARGAMEPPGQLLGMGGPGLRSEQTADAGDSLRQRLGPRGPLPARGCGRCVLDVELTLLLDHDRLGGGRLVLGPQPAHETFGLLGAPLLVQLDQPRDYFIVAQIPRLAIGIEHRNVDLVMQMLHHRDQTSLVHVLLLRRQRLAGA